MDATSGHPYCYILDGKVYLKAYRDFEDREIGEVRTDEEKTIEYFEEKFIQAEEKVKTLEDSVNNASNKGSYLMKLIHLKEYLGRCKAIGDFEALLVRLEAIEGDLKGAITKNRSKNEEQKELILKEVEQLRDSIEWKETSAKLIEIQKRWLKIGKADDETEKVLNDRLKESMTHFFERKKEFLEARRMVNEDRINQYKEIIEKASGLLTASKLEDAAKVLYDLHQSWKQIGKIPRTELVELWEEFKKHSDAFYKVYNDQKKPESRPKAPKGDKLEMKRELLERAENLSELPLEEALSKAKAFQKEYKEIGYAPDAKELDDRFWKACDRIFELNYLDSVIRKRYSNFEDKEFLEQIKIKQKVLSELIKKDQEELTLFEENLERINPNSQKRKTDNVFAAKIRNQRRKLSAKKLILNQLDLINKETA